MKKIVFLIAITLLITSCKESANTNDGKTTTKTSKELFVNITFSDGPLKGTHKFIKEKGQVMSSNTISYADESFKRVNQRNSTKLSTSALISEDGKLKLMFITKSFRGKVEKGNHEAIFFTNSRKEKECGKFMILNNGHSFNFNRMYSNNETCGTTKLTGFSDWEEGTVMNRRSVSGSFTDTYALEFKNKDGKSVQDVTTEVKVSFNSRQQEMKTK